MDMDKQSTVGFRGQQRVLDEEVVFRVPNLGGILRVATTP